MKYLILVMVLGLACATGNGKNCNEQDFEDALGSSRGDVEFAEEFDFDHDDEITAADFSEFLRRCDG